MAVVKTLPTAPVIISRVPVFQPTFRRAYGPRGIELKTSWGTVKVEGKLTETHRKVLDAIFTGNLDSWRDHNGDCLFLVDPYKIAKIADLDDNPTALLELTREMMRAQIDLYDNATSKRTICAIVSKVTMANQKAQMPGGYFNGERNLWVVKISAEWMAIYNSGMVMRYKDLLPVLNRIQSGAVHALALHVLTHCDVVEHFVVDDLLTRVGAFRDEMTGSAKRKVRQCVRESQTILAKLGMRLYDGNGKLMLEYRQNERVRFEQRTCPAQPKSVEPQPKPPTSAT